jgi:hypothetical protein
MNDNTRRFKSPTGAEYTITPRTSRPGWLVTRVATGKEEIVSKLMVEKTMTKLRTGEAIPFRQINYTVAIEQAVLFLLIDKIHINPFTREYTLR